MKKKMIFITLLLLTVTLGIVPTKANSLKISDYENALNEVNKEYGTNLHIMSNEEYKIFQSNTNAKLEYLDYLNKICSTSIKVFKNENIELAKELKISIYSTTCEESQTRSTLATKNIAFFNNKNTMTLKYKYNTSSGTKYYDTAFKPVASVTRNSSVSYFIMQSYTGKFTNSNRSYSVIASGIVYSQSGTTASNRFTVNFNL